MSYEPDSLPLGISSKLMKTCLDQINCTWMFNKCLLNLNFSFTWLEVYTHLSLKVLEKKLATGFLAILFFFKILFIFRGGEGRRKGGRETSICGCLLHTPSWGPSPPPRHVPWLGIKPATLWLADQHSVHWATPARASWLFLPASQTGCYCGSWVLASWSPRSRAWFSWLVLALGTCHVASPRVPLFCQPQRQDG